MSLLDIQNLYMALNAALGTYVPLCPKKTVSRTCKGSSEKLAGSPG